MRLLHVKELTTSSLNDYTWKRSYGILVKIEPKKEKFEVKFSNKANFFYKKIIYFYLFLKYY